MLSWLALFNCLMDCSIQGPACGALVSAKTFFASSRSVARNSTSIDADLSRTAEAAASASMPSICC